MIKSYWTNRAKVLKTEVDTLKEARNGELNQEVRKDILKRLEHSLVELNTAKQAIETFSK